MNIRRAETKDIPRLIDLLYQVHRVHAEGRPDIFRLGNKKYTEDELKTILASETTPVYVAEDENAFVCGYAFCILQEVKNDPSLMDMKTLYIDDLCVDEAIRGKHIGSSLYAHVLAEAKRFGCYHVTLNVWCLNDSAMRFYEKCGLSPLKITMEQIL
ncbi:MAG: GNAT family N-acetyltransferase [Clostridia bacterium]|nr:GNAT family N-acetyltransferase [Clostridia bacterium]